MPTAHSTYGSAGAERKGGRGAGEAAGMKEDEALFPGGRERERERVLRT